MARTLTLAGFLAGVMLALTSPAGANETELSLYSGWQGAAPGRLHNSTLGDQDVSWDGKPFAMPPYWGARATWWRDSGLGFGVEVNHAKVYARDGGKLGYERLEFTDGLNLFTANLWVRTEAMGRLQPYAGLGLGFALPHVDIQPKGQARTHGYQISGPAAQWVLGAALPLNQRWALFGEYKGSFSQNHVTLDSGGTIDTGVVTHAVNIGLSLRF